MERREVGTTGLSLSVVGLGGAWLGHDPEDPASVLGASTVLEAAYESGVNWLDTSENYFDTGNEAVIGAALAKLPGDLLVCSKVAPGAVHSGGGSGFRPDQVRAACHASLRRLRREHIDLYLLHWPDRTGVPLADTWGAMADLVTDGLVRAIGLSNYDQDDIARCHQQRRVDAIQTGLNAVQYLDDRPMIAWCGQQGIAVTIYDPLAGGLLTDSSFAQARARWVGTPWEDSTVAPGLFAPENAEDATLAVARLRAIAEQVGASVAQVSLAWLLRQPGVTSVIPGTRTPARARSNAAAAEVRLSEAMLRVIDDEVVPIGTRMSGG